MRLSEMPHIFSVVPNGQCKAESTLSVVCGTFNEHTLAKIEIKSVTTEIVIYHGS